MQIIMGRASKLQLFYGGIEPNPTIFCDAANVPFCAIRLPFNGFEKGRRGIICSVFDLPNLAEKRNLANRRQNRSHKHRLYCNH